MRKLAIDFTGYVFAGGIGAIVHYSLLILLVELFSIHPAIASGFGAVLGAITIYIINRKFVFKSKKKLSSSLLKYTILIFFSTFLNSSIVFILTNHGVYYLIAQVIATGTILAFNFTCSRMWIF